MAASFGGAKVSERVKRPSSDPLPPFLSGARPPAAKSHPFSAPAGCQAPGQTLKTWAVRPCPSPKHITARWVARYFAITQRERVAKIQLSSNHGLPTYWFSDLGKMLHLSAPVSSVASVTYLIKVLQGMDESLRLSALAPNHYSGGTGDGDS